MTTVDMAEEKLGINRYNYSGTLKQVDTLWTYFRKRWEWLGEKKLDMERYRYRSIVVYTIGKSVLLHCVSSKQPFIERPPVLSDNF